MQLHAMWLIALTDHFVQALRRPSWSERRFSRSVLQRSLRLHQALLPPSAAFMAADSAADLWEVAAAGAVAAGAGADPRSGSAWDWGSPAQQPGDRAGVLRVGDGAHRAGAMPAGMA